MIRVLNAGHVELKDAFGEDLKVANFARASYMRESNSLQPKDEQLIRFLGSADPQHTAPFYSCALDFSISAPLMVARQWWKHVVASRHVEDPFAAWNEGSRRYVTDRMEFYVPDAWRHRAEHGKQGSGEPLLDISQRELTTRLQQRIKTAVMDYDRALDLGCTPEQARLFLPAYGLFIHWRWVASLYSVAHFCKLRLGEGAQGEIQEYASVIARLAWERFPVAWEALLNG